MMAGRRAEKVHHRAIIIAAPWDVFPNKVLAIAPAGTRAVIGGMVLGGPPVISSCGWLWEVACKM